MVEEERRLAGIVEEERRQHDPVPGGHDRISADMPHIGVKRLAPGDRQEDAAENGKATPPVVHQEGDRMSRVECGEHLRMVQYAGDTERRDHTEPQQHQAVRTPCRCALSRGPERQKGRAGSQLPPV